jgi:hypothetical protein
MSGKLVFLISFVFALSVSAGITCGATLWAYYPINQNDFDDYSGNGHHGRPMDGATTVLDSERGWVASFNAQPSLPSRVNCGAEDPSAGGELSVSAWIKWNGLNGNWQGIAGKSLQYGQRRWIFQLRDSDGMIQWGGSDSENLHIWSTVAPAAGEWLHIAGTCDGSYSKIYINGEIVGEGPGGFSAGAAAQANVTLGFGEDRNDYDESFNGLMDDIRIYSGTLSESDVRKLAALPTASHPSPADGAMHPETWVTLGWQPGAFAVSHDVYMGDNYDDVNDGTGGTFIINQTMEFYVAGFPGYAYPDGLVPGTTYYWRIDEVNEVEPNSPWKGAVWSFTVPPKKAYGPNPADGADSVALDVTLQWTGGFGTKLHTVYFGEDFDEVNNATGGAPIGIASYRPGPLKLAKVYYWRVDEFDGAATYKGDVWSFTTLGAVSSPYPADGAVDVDLPVILTWEAGAVAASHEVYFGSDENAVKNATKSSPEYKGPKALGEESYDPGMLSLSTTYYWRIDEANAAYLPGLWLGKVWTFTTGNCIVIDDFESYNADNPIWFTWHDGLGYGTQGNPDYFAGNGTGSAVGDETTASTCEETIVHGGSQSMPFTYDNNKQGYSKYSEAERTLTKYLDWTEYGDAELSLWFRGYPGSVSSFIEAPAGTYTMTASGADIWAVNGVEADEFHFAYKTLTGVGSIVAKVQRVDNTNAWAKAGVMIRETLNPDSAHAMMVVTPASGVSFQRRPSAGGTSVDTTTSGITAPYWVKIERDIAGNFRAYHSANGTTWTTQGTENVPMGSNVYIGLAVTAHDAALTCEAVFSNVTITGNVGGQWAHQDIGIFSNDPEPLYLAVSNSADPSAVVVHDDPAATQIDTWTEWIIPLQVFVDQGINPTNVDRIAIGIGTRGNMTNPGGSGKMFFDDIRLCMPCDDQE